MEGEFDVANKQNNNLNKMLAQYEQTLNSQFGGQEPQPRKEGLVAIGDQDSTKAANLDESSIYDQL